LAMGPYGEGPEAFAFTEYGIVPVVMGGRSKLAGGMEGKRSDGYTIEDIN